MFQNKDEYLKLRESARASVLDVSTQSIGWLKEFARLLCHCYDLLLGLCVSQELLY